MEWSVVVVMVVMVMTMGEMDVVEFRRELVEAFETEFLEV